MWEGFSVESIEQVAQTVISTIIYLASETMPFGFLYQERLVVSFIYTSGDWGNLDGSFVLKP